MESKKTKINKNLAPGFLAPDFYLSRAEKLVFCMMTKDSWNLILTDLRCRISFLAFLFVALRRQQAEMKNGTVSKEPFFQPNGSFLFRPIGSSGLRPDFFYDFFISP